MFSSFLQFFFKFYFCIIIQITIHHFSRAQHLASRFFYGLLFGYCFHLVFLLFTTCCLLLSLLSTHFIHFSFFCANYCVCVCVYLLRFCSVNKSFSFFADFPKKWSEENSTEEIRHCFDYCCQFFSLFLMPDHAWYNNKTVGCCLASSPVVIVSL